MTKRWWSRVASTLVAGSLVCAMATLPAPADEDDFETLIHSSQLADGGPIGVGADGALVFFSSFSSFSTNEDLITEEDLEASPFLSPNAELFVWDTNLNAVEQFTTTSSILNEEGDGYSRETENAFPVVSSRTLRVFSSNEEDPERQVVYAVAFLSDAQQGLGGPSVDEGALDANVKNLPEGGRLIYVWDSERKVFDSVVEEFTIDPLGADFGVPSVAMDLFRDVSKIKGHKNDVLNGFSIRNVMVAFSSSMDISGENFDGNREIFLWDRKQFLQAEEDGQDIDNSGIMQVTDSVGEPIFEDGLLVGFDDAPTNSMVAISRRGDLAFVSDGDYTGENPDGSDEIFVWNARRGFRQITDLLRGEFDTMAWSENGRTLVVGSTADITRRNPDENSEIFVWNRRKWRQITRTIEGRNSEPSIDPHGRKIAFLSTSPLFGIPKDNEVAEVVVGRRGGRRFVQITDTIEDETLLGDPILHEGPRIARKGKKLSVIFVSNADFIGRNAIGLRRVFIAPLN